MTSLNIDASMPNLSRGYGKGFEVGIYIVTAYEQIIPLLNNSEREIKSEFCKFYPSAKDKGGKESIEYRGGLLQAMY